MALRWRGRQLTVQEQVANACDDFVDLTPASDAPAVATRSNWSALLPGQEVPLIGEFPYGRQDDPCEER
jgi:hypothetical protein